MPCDTVDVAVQEREEMKERLKKLSDMLAKGQVTVEISPEGAIAFQGWEGEDRGRWSDVCAYHRLQVENPFPLRQAVARAEAMTGRKVNARAIEAGTHSHDGGKTWGHH